MTGNRDTLLRIPMLPRDRVPLKRCQPTLEFPIVNETSRKISGEKYRGLAGLAGKFHGKENYYSTAEAGTTTVFPGAVREVVERKRGGARAYACRAARES